MFSPLLFMLLTHDCIYDTTVIGLISNNDETLYVSSSSQRRSCTTGRMMWYKQPIPKCEEEKGGCDGLRRNTVDQLKLTIGSLTVERVSSTKFLGMHITEDLTWTSNTTSLSKKAQQRLHIQHHLPPPILTTFYRGIIESVLKSPRTPLEPLHPEPETLTLPPHPTTQLTSCC